MKLSPTVVACVWVGAVVACTGDGAPAERATLDLAEVSRQSLAMQGAGLVGVRRVATDRVVGWTGSDASLRVFIDDSVMVHSVADRGRIIGASPGPAGVTQVVVALAGAADVIELYGDGRAHRSWRVAVNGSPTAAVRRRRDWVIAVARPDSALEIVQLREGAPPVPLATIAPGIGGRDARPVSVGLAVDGDALVVTLDRFPFGVWRITGDSTQVRLVTLGVEPQVQAELAATPTALWASRAAVPIDSGTVHTLVDSRSDTRVIVVLSRDGRVVTTSTIQLPLAFVDVGSTRNQLCAAVRLDVTELVCFRTNWTRGRDVIDP